MNNEIRDSRTRKIIKVISGIAVVVGADIAIGFSLGRSIFNHDPFLLLQPVGVLLLLAIIALGYFVKVRRYFWIGFTIGVIGTPVALFLIFLGSCKPY